MADDKTRDADPALAARDNSDAQEARDPEQEALYVEAHRACVEAVARALDPPA